VLIPALVAFAACSGFGLTGQRTPFGAGATPYTRPGMLTAVAKSGARTADSKCVCRNKVESGWIAIDYLADSDGCGVANQDVAAHPVALIVKYSGLNIGSELEVCSRERIPAGWTLDGWVDDAEGRCPDDHPSGNPDKRTVKRIRRID